MAALRAILLLALAGIGRASVTELFRSDCNGQVLILPGTAFEAASEIRPFTSVLETLHQAINTRGAAACMAWSEEEFNHMYNPLIALIKSLDAAHDQRPVTEYQSQCSNLLGEMNFEFLFGFGNMLIETIDEDDDIALCSRDAFLRVLPDTCTTEQLLMDGDGCAFQIPLGPLVGMSDLAVQVAVDVCPGSLLPYVSARLSGSGTDKLFAPCEADAQCGAEYSCQDPLRNLLIKSDNDWGQTDWQEPAGGQPNNQMGRDLMEGRFVDELLKALLLPGGIIDDANDFGGFTDADILSISAILAQQDVTGTLATWLRSFWDDTTVSFGQGQLLPMCLPLLKTNPTDTTAQMCYDPNDGACLPSDWGAVQINAGGNVDCGYIGGTGNPQGQLCTAMGCTWEGTCQDGVSADQAACEACNDFAVDACSQWSSTGNCIGAGMTDAALVSACAARKTSVYDNVHQCEWDITMDQWGNTNWGESGCMYNTVGPPGFDVETCVQPEEPWTSGRSMSFSYNGDVFDCSLDAAGEHPDWAVDAAKTSAAETVSNRCLSAGAGSVGAEMFQVKRDIVAGAAGRRLQQGSPAFDDIMLSCPTEMNACASAGDCVGELMSALQARDPPNGSAEMMAVVACWLTQNAGVGVTSCSATTILDVGILRPWDGALPDGSSAFHPSLRYAAHIDTPPGGMDGIWYNWDCSGNGLVRVSDGILVSFQTVAVQPAVNVISSALRNIWTAFATQKNVCITDEQIQTYYLPWVPSFALSLLSTWGPGTTPSDLLPGMLSVSSVIMDNFFTDDGDCPLDVNTVDPGCLQFITDPNQGGRCDPSDSNCIQNECGGDLDTAALMPDGSPCLRASEYPSIVLPPTCTAASYASGAGCALAYDFATAITSSRSIDVKLEIGLKQCDANPFGLPAAYAKCSGSACQYGTAWCSDTDPCTNSDEQCMVLESIQDWETDCTLAHADCVEFASISDPIDKASCDSVSALTNGTACAAVMKASDAAVGACTYIAPSCHKLTAKVRRDLTGGPLDPAFVAAQPYSFEADPISYFMGLGQVPGTVGIFAGGLSYSQLQAIQEDWVESSGLYEVPDLGGQPWQERLAWGPENSQLTPDQNLPGGIYWFDQQGYDVGDRMENLRRNMEDFATPLEITGNQDTFGQPNWSVGYCGDPPVQSGPANAPVQYVFVGYVASWDSDMNGNNIYPRCNIDQQLGDNQASGQIDTNGDGQFDDDECNVDPLQQFTFTVNGVAVDPTTVALSLSPPQFSCGGDPSCGVQGKIYIMSFMGTPDPTGAAAQCTVDGNEKIPAGPLKMEGINFARGLFGLSDYSVLPTDVGYCIPTTAINNLLMLGSGEEDIEILTAVTEIQGSFVLGIHGLGEATLATGTGAAPAGASAPVVTPAFGQEVCGLQTATSTVAKMTFQMTGFVDKPAIEAELNAQLLAMGGGATWAWTGYSTTSTSAFQGVDAALIAALAADPGSLIYLRRDLARMKGADGGDACLSAASTAAVSGSDIVFSVTVGSHRHDGSANSAECFTGAPNTNNQSVCPANMCGWSDNRCGGQEWYDDDPNNPCNDEFGQFAVCRRDCFGPTRVIEFPESPAAVASGCCSSFGDSLNPTIRALAQGGTDFSGVTILAPTTATEAKISVTIIADADASAQVTAFADPALFPALPITQFDVVGTPAANPVTMTAAKVATIPGLVGTNLLPAPVPAPAPAPPPIWQTVYQWSGATAAAPTPAPGPGGGGVVQCRGDMTGDGRINIEDLLLLLSQYGLTC